MDYLYENLGDERFQEFCQALISKEFKNTQAFPVGQPDGGRDFLAYIVETNKKDFNVFQVKFVKNPLVPDIHKWLTDTIAGEVEKIQKLIPKGAKSYYLLTNVKGTAHADVGSIDKVNKILEEKITIPCLCWWRDDLSRKLEADPIFKWSYPELLSAQDIFNSVLFNNLNENKERRESVIRAYIADQYRMDNEVKFRQIELQNRLFDLFTDVPIRIKKVNFQNRTLINTLQQLEFSQHFLPTFYDPLLGFKGDNVSGAADLLLNPIIQSQVNRILLEGGPGQGKSTISQYICQIHRSRLLNIESDKPLIPEKFKKSPIRLPFKIDLRHIADWIENKNPYKESLNETYFSNTWQKSLESFIVGHIFYHSHIDNFDSNDFIAISRISPILIVFDGFDEIASLKVREEVIDFINQGIHRLSMNAKSIQILITSRPAAFSDSIGFSVETYPHFELSDITPAITEEYVEKWIKASRLDSGEASEIRKLVKDKLKLPHLRDLAKSPMQLAIFISLLRTRGESLPNKRTELYDSYIQLFFNRESEKNIIIRDNRDLIIDIHQYLAWILHSESEMYQTNGSINLEDLRKILKEYLLKEGHNTDIVDQFFNAIKERVCALVSRVQGTFEFEVQPLREYFCAKYLYNTAPYSPAGNIKTGTKPDRFHAISRNYYWQNVVRFFAGCFDKGELDMLIYKLKELQEDEFLKYTNFPRILTSQILSDWVFKQYPRLLKDVVKIIIDGINIGSILNQQSQQSNNEPIILPDDCGREEIVIECFNQLKKFPARDYASELIGLLKNNPHSTVDYWKANLTLIDGDRLTVWLEYGYLLGILHKIENDVLINILEVDKPQLEERLQILINGNRIDMVEYNLEHKRLVFDNVIAGNMVVNSRQYQNYSLGILSLILDPDILSSIILSRENNNVSFLTHLQNKNPGLIRSKTIESFFEININDDIDEKIHNFFILLKPIAEYDAAIWRNHLDPWDTFTENARKTFNDAWGINIVALIAAGIKSKDERYDDFADLSDTKSSLCKRIRCARMKSGNIPYWENQFANSDQIIFKLLIFITWATAKTLIHFMPSINNIIDSLPESDYLLISGSIKKIGQISKFNSTSSISKCNT